MRSEEWLPLAAAHAERAQHWTTPHLARRRRGEKHPVEDFLFDYYPYSPAKLERWHPGLGVTLEGPRSREYLPLAGYRADGDGATADPAWLGPRRARLGLAIRILEGTGSRPPVTGCFALHEWAMVYGLTQGEIRHAQLPLRLSPDDIAATVDSIGLRCTHIDAYRFFTSQATPLNLLVPTRETQPALEQPGCIHASMDLYKYAFWFSPLVPSDLVLDCFENAMQARELDMRASPYDVSEFGLEPIRVETAQGRREYAEEQRRMMERSAPLSERLLTALRRLALEDTSRRRFTGYAPVETRR